MDYVDLRKQVIDAGLLDRQYWYYAFKVASTLAVLSGLLALLFYSSNIWLQLLVVIALAFAFVQVGLLGHDAAHLAIFKSVKWNELAGLLFFGLLTGIGYNHWVWRHNAHHANPNQEEEDPDVSYFAQTAEELAKKRGIARLFYERQHWFFLLIMASSVTAFQVYGMAFNFRMKNSFLKLADSFMMGLHFAVFWAVPFLLFAWWKALLLIFSLRLLMGLYFGTISATNHKGMMVVKKGQELDFAEKQILTTRNVRRGVVVDFVYGCLNYQLEHHLFPTMPRNNFNKCKPLVKKFCRENNLLYEETGVVESYRQILGALRSVALSARKGKEVQAQPVAFST